MVKAYIARRTHQQIGIWEKEAATLLDGILELSTGEAIMISTRRVVTFHASSLLTAKMNTAKSGMHEAVTPTE